MSLVSGCRQFLFQKTMPCILLLSENVSSIIVNKSEKQVLYKLIALKKRLLCFLCFISTSISFFLFLILVKVFHIVLGHQWVKTCDLHRVYSYSVIFGSYSSAVRDSVWCVPLFIDTHVTGGVLINQGVRSQMPGEAFLRELGPSSLTVAESTKNCSPKPCHCQGVQR